MTGCEKVTFRKEGVDWNSCINRDNRGNWVTFRKEGVDWNEIIREPKCTESSSPSVRKVWIEIEREFYEALGAQVTFRKEGVDWNQS